MRRTRQTSTPDGDGPAQDPTAPRAADAKEVLAMAQHLRAMVQSVNPDEFSWQEAHYDRDSRQGRELLFLMANHEWVRATSEIVDIARSDSIETTIKIDIDLSKITHEAFRKRPGRLWLPVAVLPPQIAQRQFEPDVFATVTDAAGNPVPMLPGADLRHQLSAAMAEIIAKMAVSHLPAPRHDDQNGDHHQGDQAEESPVATRDERLLLAAAIYRLLRRGSSQPAGLPESRSASETPRMARARKPLLKVLDHYTRLLAVPPDTAGAVNEVPREPRFTPELARRAVKVLQALAESAIVVVLVDHVIAPSVLTVRVPARKLKVSKPSWIKPWTWIIRPSGRLGIDVLLPTADADRQIQVNLPDGVSVDLPAGRTKRAHGQFPHLDIAVHVPLPLHDLSASIEQVLAAAEQTWPVALVESFVDLARVKSAVALDTLRHYKVNNENGGAPPPAGNHEATGKSYAILKQLGAGIAERDEINTTALADLEGTWRPIEADKLSLSRHTSTDLLNPHTVISRTDMIEDVSQRAIPRKARVCIDVTVDDHDYFSTARSSAFMSLVLMLGVLCFLLGWRVINPKLAPVPEVLAIVLTLFATIQAGRIERPDRSTLRGQLFAIGNWLIGASVLPAITLAVALAFQLGEQTAARWAGACIVAQVFLLFLMRRGPLTPAGWPRIGKRRILDTEALNYSHFETLRSDYWRNTTAEALMIGRMAYGYVIWKKADPDNPDESVSPKLRPLLTWGNNKQSASAESSSVLALLRSGTLSQAVTFIVFRGKPDDKWLAGNNDRQEIDDRQELGLDPGRLVPADSVTSMVDVFVGVCRDEMPTIKEHPLVIILKTAANKLIVLDAQLPVPAPVQGYDNRKWARIRLALRDREDIRRLSSFLHGVCEEMSRPENSRHVVAVQAVPAVRPRVIGESAAGSDRTQDKEDDVLTSDLDVVNGAVVDNERADVRTWRALAICADARSNIESDIIQHLACVREHFQLAGLTYALLHGTAVIFMLVHEPQPEEDHAASLEADLRKTPAWAKLRVLVDKRLDRDELGPVAEYPLLRVRFRWQDRPGAFLNVLDSINSVLIEELPSIQRQDWSVAYARLQVLTGQVALGHLTIRMHIPAAEMRDWNSTRMEEIGRKIEMLAASDAATGQDASSASHDLDKLENPVINIDRIKKVRPADGRS